MNTSSLRSLPLVFFGLTLGAGSAGCGLILGLGDFTEGAGTGSGGATTSGTGGTASSTGGAGGTGGTGGAEMACTPKAARPCYDGAAGTENKGACKGGTQTCADDGSSFGPCVGEVVPTPENCGAPQDEDCNGTAAQCTGTSQWGKRFGNSTGDQGLSGVALDGKGNTIISGDLNGTVDFGKGGITGNIYLAKIDPVGAPVFSKALPGGKYFSPLMAIDSDDNIVLAGRFPSSADIDFGGGNLDKPGADNFYLVKLSPDGKHLMSKTIGYGAARPYDVATGPDGSVFISGLLLGVADLGAGPLGVANAYSAFVARYDKNGNHVYSRRYSTPANIGGAQAQAIAVDKAGNAVIGAGIYGNLVDFGGVKLSSSDGAFVLVKIDPTGNVMTAKQFTGVLAGVVDASMGVATLGNYDVAVDPGGDIFVAGAFTGSANFGTPALMDQGGKDIFIAKLDSMGGHLWSKRAGSAGDQIATHIAVDMFGNPAVTGVFPDTLNLENSIYLGSGLSKENVFGMKLDTSGNYLWALSSSGAAASKLGSTNIAVGALGDVVLAGVAQNQFVFGMVPAQAGGFFDTYVAKLAP